MTSIESILLAVTRVSTFAADRPISNATGFLFERDDQTYFITNRHVVLDEPTDHRPDRLEIELHVSEENVAEVVPLSIPLYANEQPVWKQATDSSGTVDIVAIELPRDSLPETMLYHPFTPEHLVDKLERIEVGAPLLIVGFPLGFHDTLHHLPVARQAVVASAFGLRFQGNGYFLTDARMHRGTSGAPVVTRMTRQPGRGSLPWTLLGVHSGRMDVPRDISQDEFLSLNCAWYADVLLTLTERPAEPTASARTELSTVQAARGTGRTN
jgi:S1-C subfamily serine protease